MNSFAGFIHFTDVRDEDANWISTLRQQQDDDQFAHAKQYQCSSLTLLGGQCSESVLFTDGSALYVSGTIFNKEELATMVSRPLYEYNHDAALLHSLILEQGMEAVASVSGRFLVIYCNREQQKIYLLNDAIHGEQVFYHLSADALIFASDVMLLRAHLNCPGDETGIIALKDHACFSFL